MADGEDQPQPLVGDRAHDRFLVVHVPAECAQLGLERRLAPGPAALAADPVDRAVARRGDDPRRRVGRRAIARPALEGDEERVLDGLLGAIEVAEDAREQRDRLPRLAPEQAVDEDVAGIRSQPCIAS
jgi:hypothetical protein